MSHRPDAFAALPLELKHLVNDACQHFEAALRTGHRLRVEHYLATVTEPVRTLLARELLLLECEHALRAGKTVAAEELLSRYGVEGTLLAECLREAGEAVEPERSDDRPEEKGEFRLPAFGRY